MCRISVQPEKPRELVRVQNLLILREICNTPDGVDYRTFRDLILISPDIDYTISPEGRPMFCTFKYDVVIGDNEVERTDFEYFLLQVVPNPITGVRVPDDHWSTAVVFIVEDDSELLLQLFECILW